MLHQFFVIIVSIVEGNLILLKRLYDRLKPCWKRILEVLKEVGEYEGKR